ncbi:MAG: hypothetical protein AVDCRST_MAG32-1538 [uncultured Nocardioides sp.]|uniref:Uncharacterized protein n=1 Tax=uncultured Nocardioides sp. TaxID=198441 RepID=A0A6J4N4U7_9ACTN|nr:MAG: hypothetical protein AVDCRST_MAG32-1538 [uncultured Nocardioides sp.]
MPDVHRSDQEAPRVPERPSTATGYVAGAGAGDRRGFRLPEQPLDRSGRCIQPAHAHAGPEPDHLRCRAGALELRRQPRDQGGLAGAVDTAHRDDAPGTGATLGRTTPHDQRPRDEESATTVATATAASLLARTRTGGSELDAEPVPRSPRGCQPRLSP